MMITATPEQIPQIVEEAKDAARQAATNYFHEVLGGRDQMACGFAWVTILGVKGNTKIGRALIANDVRKSYTGGLQLWNPSTMMVQNVDTLSAGAEAAARVFKSYGFDAYADSRLD